MDVYFSFGARPFLFTWTGMKEEGMIGTLHVDLDPFLDLFPLAMMREITWQIKGLQGDLGQFQKSPIYVKREISSLLTGLIKERMDGILTTRTTHMVDLTPKVLGKTLVASQDLVLGPTGIYHVWFLPYA